MADLDPVPQSDPGVHVPGQVGPIYQAVTEVYLGPGRARTLRLLPGGQVRSERALRKGRTLERGHRFVVERLQRERAPPLRGDPHAWPKEWLRG